jgi:hypothetical protein
MTTAPAPSFALDITLGAAMYHVRADTAAELANNVLLIRALFPVLAAAPELATIHGAQASGLRAAPAAPRAVPASPPPPPPARVQAAPMPTCPISGTAAQSKFYPGLFCPKSHDGARCQWSHKCTAACAHAAA